MSRGRRGGQHPAPRPVAALTPAGIADDIWSLLGDDTADDPDVTVASAPGDTFVLLAVGSQTFQIDVTEVSF